MKVELESLLRKALLKGCLWMGESGGNSEGGEDEASKQLTASIERSPIEENGVMSLFN